MTSAPHLGKPYVSYWREITVQGSRIFKATRFSMDCEISFPKYEMDDFVMFDVVFQMDDIPVYSVTVNASELVVTMNETHLVGHIGKTVSDLGKLCQ